MKKKVISLLLITTLAISSIIGCSCSNTTDNKTSVATTTEKETEASNDDTIVETDAQGNIVVNTSTKPSSDEATKNESSSDATSEATSDTSETTKPQETSKPSSTTKPTETTKQEETTKVKYTYKNLNKTMYAKSTVNVRSLPSTDGDKLGSLSKGKEVKVTGQCNETNWYRIEFNDKIAYVSNTYLVTEKPVETTTAKPNNTTKPTSKPSSSEETTKKPITSTWKPEYYTASDRVGDGLDEYRIGLQKYSSDGTQLYVKTNYTDRHNGFYAVPYFDDAKLEEKHEAFKEAFENKYQPPTGTGGFQSRGVDIGNEKIDDTVYYMQFWNIWPYEGSETVNSKKVYVYDWEEVKILSDYAYIMPMYVTHYKDETHGITGTETLEEFIAKVNMYAEGYEKFSVTRYKKGEQLAKKYGLDFHGLIESYKN